MLAALSRCQATCGPALRFALPPAVTGSLLTACGSVRSLVAAAAPPAAGAAAEPAAAPWRQRFEDISPGSVLRIDLPHAETDLSVKVGEHEAMELSGSSAELAAQRAEHDGHPGSSLVTVSAGTPSSSGLSPLRLEARGPSRFFTVEATTGGGSVAVEVVQEGSLRLRTGGGSIAVPKVKAFDAHLDSAGGAITGAVTGVDVRLHSGGGSVRLKSLVGKSVEVVSGGGPVTLGACYADKLDVHSGGGPVHITNIDCRGGQAALRTAGGPVTIDSLDGNCVIESQGGNVQVQLHDNAGSVSVESGGGDIQLFLSPGAAGRLWLRNAGRVAARPGTVRMAMPQDDGSLLLQLPLGLGPAAGSQPVTGLGLRPPGAGGVAAAAAAAAGAQQPPLSRLQRAAGAVPPQPQQHERPPPGNAVTSASREGSGADIVLDAGGTGTISITERGWMDALRQKHGVQ